MFGKNIVCLWKLADCSPVTYATITEGHNFQSWKRTHWCGFLAFSNSVLLSQKRQQFNKWPSSSFSFWSTVGIKKHTDPWESWYFSLHWQKRGIQPCTGLLLSPANIKWKRAEGKDKKALDTLSPKSSPLPALGVCSIDWNNSWIILSRQLKYTHPTLLGRICEK